MTSTLGGDEPHPTIARQGEARMADWMVARHICLQREKVAAEEE